MKSSLQRDYGWVTDVVIFTFAFMLGVYYWGPAGYATLAYVCYRKEPRVAIGVALAGTFTQNIEQKALGFAVSIILTAGAYSYLTMHVKDWKPSTKKYVVIVTSLLITSIVFVGLTRYTIDSLYLGEANSPTRRIIISFVTSVATIGLCEYYERKR